MHTRTVAAASLLVVCGLSGCGDKSDTPASASATAKATSSAGSSAKKADAPPTAVASAAANLPDKGPWDAVKITYTKDDPKDGSPYFKMENLGGKTIKVCFMDFYGYDASGKQVAHLDLSWNGELKGGKIDDSVYTHKTEAVKTWEATYHGIEFEGDTSPTMDDKRAPAQRPKGG